MVLVVGWKAPPGPGSLVYLAVGDISAALEDIGSSGDPLVREQFFAPALPILQVANEYLVVFVSA